MADGPEPPFLMVVEDVFRHASRGGRGVRVTGRVERGWVRVGDEVEVVGFGAGAATVPVLAVEAGGVELRDGVRLAVYLRAATVMGTVALLKGTEVLRPLHQGPVAVALEHPVPVERGQRFAVRHAGRAVGSESVTGLSR
ncbi:hypothetical protein ACFU5N_20490 [Streptomyces albidoflavus]